MFRTDADSSAVLYIVVSSIPMLIAALKLNVSLYDLHEELSAYSFFSMRTVTGLATQANTGRLLKKSLR